MRSVAEFLSALLMPERLFARSMDVCVVLSFSPKRFVMDFEAPIFHPCRNEA